MSVEHTTLLRQILAVLRTIRLAVWLLVLLGYGLGLLLLLGLLASLSQPSSY